jgi:hypothetical protein
MAFAECVNQTREYENPRSGVEVWRGATSLSEQEDLHGLKRSGSPTPSMRAPDETTTPDRKVAPNPPFAFRVQDAKQKEQSTVSLLSQLLAHTVQDRIKLLFVCLQCEFKFAAIGVPNLPKQLLMVLLKNS